MGEKKTQVSSKNPAGEIRQCDLQKDHEGHEYQPEFGAYFNVYCPGLTLRALAHSGKQILKEDVDRMVEVARLDILNKCKDELAEALNADAEQPWGKLIGLVESYANVSSVRRF